MPTLARPPPSNGFDGVLRTRVDTLTDDVRGLHDEMRDVRTTMATRSDISALSQQIGDIASKQDTISHPNWQMWSVAVAVLGLVGYILYWPITKEASRLDTALMTVVDRGVFQKQYDADQQRTTANLAKLQEEWSQTILARRYDADQVRQTGINDHAATKADVDQALLGLRGQVNSNDERIRYISGNYFQTKDFDAQHGDLKAFLSAQVMGLQRQIDSAMTRLNETWSARDALLSINQRLDRVEGKSGGK